MKKTLSVEEEKKLIFNYQTQKDKSAMLEIVVAFQKLVISISLKHLSFGSPLMDLVQEGNIGLINALEKFDLSKNVHFGTYAKFFIKSKIQNYIFKESSIISFPISAISKKMFSILGARRSKKNELAERENNQNDISEKINYYSKFFNQSKNLIEDLLIFFSSSTVSLENQADDEKQSLINKLKSDEESQEEQLIKREEFQILKKKLEETIKMLSMKEREIIKKRWLTPLEKPLRKKKRKEKEIIIEKMALRKIKRGILMNKLK